MLELPAIDSIGWAVVGLIPQSLITGPSNKASVNLGFIDHGPSLPEVKKRFQSSDCFGVVSKVESKKQADKSEDEGMISIISQSVTRTLCGYVIELPLRSDITAIPNNRSQAVFRFLGIERRLLLPEVQHIRTKFEQIISNLLSSGTVVAVDRQGIDDAHKLIWYLPYFFVTNPNKPDKIRVVFDAAARFKGVSYNSLLKVSGRLEHADLPACARNPIILAHDHHLTKLIVIDCNERIHHSGVEP